MTVDPMLEPVRVDSLWEPVLPSVAVATEAYQFLLEKHRQHPEDIVLIDALEHAHSLMCFVWRKDKGMSV